MKHALKGFTEWFVVTIISDSRQEDSDQFNKLVRSADYTSDAVDLKLLVNGLPFDLTTDTFVRIEQHIDEKVEERAKESAFAVEKMDAIRRIMDMRTPEQLKDFMDGN